VLHRSPDATSEFFRLENEKMNQAEDEELKEEEEFLRYLYNAS